MRRRAGARFWRSVFRPGALGHPAKGGGKRHLYALVNSIRGLRWARIFGKSGVDRDLRFTKDGIPVVTHWSLLHKDGFNVGLTFRVEEHTWAEIQALVGPRGVRIHTLWDDLRECGRLGLVPFLEPKSNDARFHDAAWWGRVVVYAQKHGVKKVRGYALKANRLAVPAMRAAGIPAKVLAK